MAEDVEEYQCHCDKDVLGVQNSKQKEQACRRQPAQQSIRHQVSKVALQQRLQHPSKTYLSVTMSSTAPKVEV
jgi:hypothetical protein